MLTEPPIEWPWPAATPRRRTHNWFSWVTRLLRRILIRVNHKQRWLRTICNFWLRCTYSETNSGGRTQKRTCCTWNSASRSQAPWTDKCRREDLGIEHLPTGLTMWWQSIESPESIQPPQILCSKRLLFYTVEFGSSRYQPGWLTIRGLPLWWSGLGASSIETHSFWPFWLQSLGSGTT